MSYTPTTWAAGDTVTAAKLNKLEQGVASGGGALVVHETVSEGTRTLDKTWQEIHDALAQGIPCVTVYANRNNVEQGQISFVSGIPGNLFVDALMAQGAIPAVMRWSATSADGYPSKSTGGGDVV